MKILILALNLMAQGNNYHRQEDSLPEYLRHFSYSIQEASCIEENICQGYCEQELSFLGHNNLSKQCEQYFEEI